MKTSAIIKILPIVVAIMHPSSSTFAADARCDDPKSADGWRVLLEKHPGDSDLRKLFHRRKTLCRQIELDLLPLEDGAARFEQARQRLIEKWTESNKRMQPELPVAG